MRGRAVGFDSRGAFAWVLVFISLGHLGLGACHTPAPPERWVRVFRSSIPADEIRAGTRIDVGVQAQPGMSIQKVTVGLPSGAVWHPMRVGGQAGMEIGFVVNPETPMRDVGFGGVDRRSAFWAGGEITPGKAGRFTVLFRASEAETGDTLFFPVGVLSSDSSLMEWNGPPGSEWPAPMVVVGRAVPRMETRPALVAVALALAVLLFAGLYKVRQHRGRSSEGSLE